MRVGLNNPGGAPIGRDLLADLANLGIESLRCDVPNSGDLTAHVEPYIGSGVRPLFILHTAARHEPLADLALDQLGPDGYDLEVFNEPTGQRGPQTGPGDMVTFTDYIEGIAAVQHDARARGFRGRIYAGAPANIGPDWWGWLVNTMGMVPRDVDLAVHRYSYKTQDDRNRPWPPFSSRLAELDALHRIADGRTVAVTEFGYHTAEERTGMLWWAQTFSLTDDQVLENLIADFRLYEVGFVSAVYVYNINDGAGSSAGDRWGIRRIDGSWKPAARAFREWRT